MALIGCPECLNVLSDTAPGCPKCGYILTPEFVAEVANRRAEIEAESEAFTKRWTAIIGGCAALLVIGCYLTSGLSEPASAEWTPQNLATLREIQAKERASSYSTAGSYRNNMARHHQLGQKRYPSQAEIRDYLILDARLSVQEGQMSVSDFESWTVENY